MSTINKTNPNSKTVPLTPAMQQYLKIKDDHPDSLIFYRMGDFYELFYEDAVIASKVLNITLTSRDREKSIPMAGIPYHAIENYITKLIKQNYKVVIVEQTDKGENGGVFKRDIHKIITPGTNTYYDSHDYDENLLFALVKTKKNILIASVDINIGVINSLKANSIEDVLDIIRSKDGKEVLLTKSTYKIYQKELKVVEKILTFLEEDDFYNKHGNISAEAGLIKYIKKNQRIKELIHIKNSSKHQNINSSFPLDYSTVKNLEIISGNSNRQISLFNELNLCKTPQGKLKLKQWLLNPLSSKDLILNRQEHIRYFIESDLSVIEFVNSQLTQTSDLYRIASKISLNSCSPKEIYSLAISARVIDEITKYLQEKTKLDSKKAVFEKFVSNVKNILLHLEPYTKEILMTLNPECSLSVKSGNNINIGISKELDELKDVKMNAGNWLKDFETKEQKSLGIKSLKVKYNRVFGYFIEIPKTYNIQLDPTIYHRKQTLVNTERYITTELKYQENLILNSDSLIVQQEVEIFNNLVNKLKTVIDIFQNLADHMAELDIFVNHALWSLQRVTCTPHINEEGLILIQQGQHPTIAGIIRKNNNSFVPNDIEIGSNNNSVHLITGPNMGGKSTYIRQIGILAIMALCGLCIPAKSANISLLDNIFTRVGASDNISEGYSTFMVEMTETATILRKASKRSLVILDEIGRGTGTYDGISIAWAILEYLSKNQIKTLFATHYLELTEAANVMKNVTNYTLKIHEDNNEIVFLHKICKGKADRSYGLHVARLAGIPKEILNRANKTLKSLESRNNFLSSRPVELF